MKEKKVNEKEFAKILEANYNYRIGTSYMLFNNGGDILFVDIFGNDDGVSLATSIDNGSQYVSLISSINGTSKSTKKNIINGIVADKLPVILERDLKIKLSKDEYNDIINSLLTNV